MERFMLWRRAERMRRLPGGFFNGWRGNTRFQEILGSSRGGGEGGVVGGAGTRVVVKSD